MAPTDGRCIGHTREGIDERLAEVLSGADSLDIGADEPREAVVNTLKEIKRAIAALELLERVHVHIKVDEELVTRFFRMDGLRAKSQREQKKRNKQGGRHAESDEELKELQDELDKAKKEGNLPRLPEASAGTAPPADAGSSS